MLILTLNCGSSSLKYQVYNWDKSRILCRGLLEGIGQKSSTFNHESIGISAYKTEGSCANHREALHWVQEILTNKEHGCLNSLKEIAAVGHRIVHGGSLLIKSVKIDENVLRQLKLVENLAPLHNPAGLMSIHSTMELLPNIPQCIITDTAWHQTIPEVAYTYAVPKSWREQYGVRRYGFHGISYLYTAKRAAVLLKKRPLECNLIICHIGNGSSVCAVSSGVSIDTSMGMTPLEGLVMGTRSGDIDASIVGHMVRTGKTVEQIDMDLNKKSGLLGLAGVSDRREINDGMKNNDADSTLAHNVEVYRLRKYIAAYLGVLEKLPDAIIFTAGVGELDIAVRRDSLKGLEHMGIKLDLYKNELSLTRHAETCISAADSKVKIFVIPTDEELVMTEDTYALINGTYDVHMRYNYVFSSPSYSNSLNKDLLLEDIKKCPDLKSICI